MGQKNYGDSPEELLWPHERVCPECGKRFCAPMLEFWTYKIQKGSKNLVMCSWTCYRKAKRKNPVMCSGIRNEVRQQLVLDMKDAGMSNAEIARELGISANLVCYYVRKGEMDAAGD